MKKTPPRSSSPSPKNAEGLQAFWTGTRAASDVPRRGEGPWGGPSSTLPPPLDRGPCSRRPHQPTPSHPPASHPRHQEGLGPRTARPPSPVTAAGRKLFSFRAIHPADTVVCLRMARPITRLRQSPLVSLERSASSKPASLSPKVRIGRAIHSPRSRACPPAQPDSRHRRPMSDAHHYQRGHPVPARLLQKHPPQTVSQELGTGCGAEDRNHHQQHL